MDKARHTGCISLDVHRIRASEEPNPETRRANRTRSWKAAPSVVALVHPHIPHYITVVSEQSMQIHTTTNEVLSPHVLFFIPDRNPYPSPERSFRPRLRSPEPRGRGDAGPPRPMGGVDQSEFIASRIRKERPVRTLFVRNIKVRPPRRLVLRV